MLRDLLAARSNLMMTSARAELRLLTQEQYVLDNGVQMYSSDPLTEEQYEYLILISGSIDCLPKQCFHNAQMMTLIDNTCKEPRVKYHEGYVFTGITPILHAWITLDDKIVDVTLSTNPDSAQRFYDGVPPQKDLLDRVLGVIPDKWEYIGVPLDSEYVVRNLTRNNESRSLIDNWQDNWPLLRRED